MEFKKLQKIIAEVLGIGDMEIFQEMSFVDDPVSYTHLRAHET